MAANLPDINNVLTPTGAQANTTQPPANSAPPNTALGTDTGQGIENPDGIQDEYIPGITDGTFQTGDTPYSTNQNFIENANMASSLRPMRGASNTNIRTSTRRLGADGTNRGGYEIGEYQQKNGGMAGRDARIQSARAMYAAAKGNDWQEGMQRWADRGIEEGDTAWNYAGSTQGDEIRANAAEGLWGNRNYDYADNQRGGQRGGWLINRQDLNNRDTSIMGRSFRDSRGNDYAYGNQAGGMGEQFNFYNEGTLG